MTTVLSFALKYILGPIERRKHGSRSSSSSSWLSAGIFLVMAGCVAELRATAPVRFVRFSIEQGLSQGTVQAILQDDVGYLWFGTEEGLNRYDGYSFVIFKHDAKDPSSLSDNIINALCEDRQHRLWVGTEHGLCRFDPRTETFTTIPVIRDRVAEIVESSDGTLWFACAGGGLFLLKPGTDDFVSYQPVANDPGSLASYLVSSVLEDNSGRLWLGTSNAGLELFNRKTGEFGNFVHFRHDPADPNSISHNQVWDLARDKTGSIWVATYGGGLNLLDPKTGHFRHYRHQAGDDYGLPTDLITSVSVDRAGMVWVGTDGFGLLRFDPTTDRFTAYKHVDSLPTSLSNNVVRSIYEDTQGQLWVGVFQGGVNQLKKTRNEIAYYTHADAEPAGLSDSNVSAFLQDAEGRIWLGTEQGRLNHFDRKTGQFTHYRYPSSPSENTAILSLLQDRQGRIWVGSYRGGIAQFDPNSGNFRVYQHDPSNPQSLVDDSVWAMAEAENGMLWLATSAGLVGFDPEGGKIAEHNTAPLKNTELRTVLVDQKGSIWVGGFGGLSVLHRGAKAYVDFRHDEHNPRSLSNDAVVSLREDHLGRLWIGTIGGGLNLLDPATGTFTCFRDFPSNVINSIQEDSSDRIWVSTNHGLSRLAPTTGTIENYDLTNGLQSLQFHLRAGLKTNDGRLLFGSTEGFYDLDPAALTLSNHAPPVVLTSLRIFNQPVRLPVALPMLDDLKLTPHDNVFSLEYAALDYTYPRRNRYAYRMDGFGDRWIEMGEKREITFTNLDPGRYVFRVKASNSDGVWNDASTTVLHITMTPPMWRTWWFRGSAIALLMLVIVTVHRARVRRITRMIAERQRAADALRASDDRYRALIAGAQDAIFTLTGDGRIQDVNEAGSRITGWDHDQWIGRSFQDAILEEDAPLAKSRFVEVMTGQRPQSFELRLRTHTGEVAVLEFALSPLIEGGVVAGLLGIGRDVTERLRATEAHAKLEQQFFQAQKMEAVGTLAGGIAHDFNNILTGIFGNTQLAVMNLPPTHPVQEDLRQVMQASQRARDLVRQILTFSRQQVQQRVPVQLHTIVEEALNLLRPSLPATIEIRLQLLATSPFVLADATQLHQVLMNLATNAAHAMEKTGGQLDLRQDVIVVDEAAVRRRPQLRCGRFVHLTVSDTGCGMDAATINRIFEPFFTTKAPGKGTGLGLSVVLGIVQQHDGFLLVDSAPGQGTAFQIFLPICTTTANASASIAAELPRGQGQHIIVVDDEEMVIRVATGMLERLGYRVSGFIEPAEALSAIQQNPSGCALMITDLTMPKMTGTALAEKIRRLCPDLSILLCTGFDGAVGRDELTRLKLLGPLIKPFTVEALAVIISEALHPLKPSP
jgi:two-component system, sensor histidine kinase and response regulator